VLALLLAASCCWTFRNVLAARYPAAQAGCWPAAPCSAAASACRPDRQPGHRDRRAATLGVDTYSLNTLLRNQGSLVQAWPSIELELTDANDKPVLRRVFGPADYLPPDVSAAAGFAARSEQPVRLNFALTELKAVRLPHHRLLSLLFTLQDLTMTKTALICGSIAFDKIMQYHGRFGETLLADQLHRVNVSFLVPTLRTEFGGCAVNIAYNLKMLGGDPLIMGTIGQDGGDYLERIRKQGLATNAIRPSDAYTAQCFVTADLDNNQINAFHPGAMQFSHENNLADYLPLRVAIISPDGRDGMIKHARDCAERACPSSSIRASSCRCSAAKSC
jgi:hypothetical protein